MAVGVCRFVVAAPRTHPCTTCRSVGAADRGRRLRAASAPEPADSRRPGPAGGWTLLSHRLLERGSRPGGGNLVEDIPVCARSVGGGFNDAARIDSGSGSLVPRPCDAGGSDATPTS